jgi:hypothetical protein
LVLLPGIEEEVQAKENRVAIVEPPRLNLSNFTFSDEEEVFETQIAASGQDNRKVGEEKTPTPAVAKCKKNVRRASSFLTPVVKKRKNNMEQKEDDSFDNIMKYMMMQRQMEIDSENRRRD